MRALEACGDGFWELDLQDGSAWFSDWFYRKLAWPHETKRHTLAELQSLLKPPVWNELLGKFRDQLERNLPLDFEFDVQLPDGSSEWWHIRGIAERNSAGQPICLSGSMRDASLDRGAPRIPSSLLCLHEAFDALPVAAGLLDGQGTVLQSNRLWREFPPGVAAHLSARLRAANSQTAIEFWADWGGAEQGGSRRMRVRALAFPYNGRRHLAVTVEEPTPD